MIEPVVTAIAVRDIKTRSTIIVLGVVLSVMARNSE